MKRLATLTWFEVEQYVRHKPAVILPVGSIEQHGPLLPLETDLIIAEEVSLQVAERLGILIAPSISYATSLEHSRFPGTISINPQILIDTITEVGRSLKSSGFNYLFIINGHAGNSGALDVASRILKKEQDLVTYVFNLQEMLGGIAREMNILSDIREHAGVVETSIMKFLNKIKETTDIEVFLKKTPKSYSASGIMYGWMIDEYSETGVIGEVSKADEKIGQQLLERAVGIICSVIDEVLNPNQR